jgi:Uma2 family endonuclease
MAGAVAVREPVRRLTEAEFLASSDFDGFELVDGVPVEVNMGGTSAWVGTQISYQIARFLHESGTGGLVFAQETAFKAWPQRPDHLRKPDTMYFVPGRYPGDLPPDGTIDRAPDLAVEVVSLNDDARELDLKVQEYLRAGIRLIWVIYPDTHNIHTIRASGQDADIGSGATLSGEEILPGFEVPVDDLFPR